MLKLIVDEILSPPAAGGGSSFAHLTEDVGNQPYNQRLIADWLLQIGPADFSTPVGRYGAAFIEHFLHPGAPVPSVPVYDLWTDAGNGNNPIFSWNEDGSLHWGDGTAVPDTTLQRDPGGAGLVVGASTDYSTDSVWLDYGFVGVFRADDNPGVVVGKNSEARPRAELHADGSLHWGDGTAAPDVSLTRDGANELLVLGIGTDQYNLHVQEAGGAALTNVPYSELGVGIVTVSNGTHTVSLGVDGLGNLTVNGVAITVP